MAEAQRTMPRLKQEYNETHPRGAAGAVRLQNEMQIPKLDKIVLNMGVGEATADSKKLTVAADDLADDRRPEGRHHPRPQVDRRLQGPREHADRRQGHAAQASACTSSSTAW